MLTPTGHESHLRQCIFSLPQNDKLAHQGLPAAVSNERGLAAPPPERLVK